MKLFSMNYLLVVVAVFAMAQCSYGDVVESEPTNRGASLRGVPQTNRGLKPLPPPQCDDCFPSEDPPTKPPIEAPVKPPTKPPTLIKLPQLPLPTPTTAPTKAPTFVIKLPPFPLLVPTTKAPTKAPTKVPTKAPTKSVIQAPIETPVQVPIQAPAAAPTKAVGRSKKCGLFDLNIFCPVRRCGVVGRLVGMCK
jgi:hypothetical protein